MASRREEEKDGVLLLCGHKPNSTVDLSLLCILVHIQFLLQEEHELIAQNETQRERVKGEGSVCVCVFVMKGKKTVKYSLRGGKVKSCSIVCSENVKSFKGHKK